MLKTLTVVRPINLIIILLTMMVVQSNIYAHANQPVQWNVQWWLKMLLMLLLAASGNVINDIWDQKVDAINRGKKQIIGNGLSPIFAKRLYGVLMFFVFILAFQIFLISKKGLLIYTPLTIALGLFLYTPVFKRLPWVGNIWVAACIGFVPLWAMLGKWKWTFDSEIFTRVFFLSLMAFIANWIREIVKDMIDRKGDEICGYSSLVIAYGQRFTIVFIRWLLLALMMLIVLYLSMGEQHDSGIFFGLLLMIAPGVLLLFIAIRNWNDLTPKKLSFLLKYWMLLALLQFYLS